MNNTDIQNISDIIAGKKAINVEIPAQNILMLAIAIFLSVLLAVMIANTLSNGKN